MSEQESLSNPRLRSFVERIERLEAEKKAIADDIKEVKDEAKSAGLDVKTINKIIKLRKLTPEQRDEEEALLDIYKAALGMLNDTPLGEAAVRKLSPKREEQTEAPAPQKYNTPELEGIDINQAREMGSTAASEGKPVTSNPFPAHDSRRAAWDEAWCSTNGSDGMDIPEAWKRSKPKKPGSGEEGGEEQ